MAYLPALAEAGTSRLMTEVFTGYDHNLKIADGSWYEEKNLSSVSYPLFSPRQRRGEMVQLNNPQGILSKDALAYVDGSTLYYNHLPVDGIVLSTRKEDCPKQMVSMGAYLCIFPDGVHQFAPEPFRAVGKGFKFSLGHGPQTGQNRPLSDPKGVQSGVPEAPPGFLRHIVQPGSALQHQPPDGRGGGVLRIRRRIVVTAFP